MGGKFFTILGIVVIFGWFIQQSFVDPSSETVTNKIIMNGADTLNKDWKTIFAQRERDAIALYNAYMSQNNVNSIYGDNTGQKTKTPEEVGSLLTEDPYQREKINSDNYTTIESSDGREIITGYNRPEEEETDMFDKIKTRHSREGLQPRIQLK